jgi:hypothetical protein
MKFFLPFSSVMSVGVFPDLEERTALRAGSGYCSAQMGSPTAQVLGPEACRGISQMS